MSLIEKLKEITVSNQVRTMGEIVETQDGKTVKEMWDDVISQNIFSLDDEVVLGWHRLLMKYITETNAVFPLRCQKKFRGYLTEVPGEYSFLFVDNEHVKYYREMYEFGYVPSVKEIMEAYRKRVFPITIEKYCCKGKEKYAAFRNRLNTVYNGKGYYLAHIFSVNSGYEGYGGEWFGDIVKKFFVPANGRSYCMEEWAKKVDEYGGCYKKEVNGVNPKIKSYIVASFLRYIHPFNHFWMPLGWNIGVNRNVGEDEHLVEYVKTRYKNMYEKKYEAEYKEFINLIKLDNKEFEPLEDNENIVLKYVIKKSDIKKRGEKVKVGVNKEKYEFDNVMLGKGKLVLNVVKDYIEKHKGVKLDDLGKVFPRELNKDFDVVANFEDLTESKKKRFFCKENDLIVLEDGTVVAVCSQWERNGKLRRNIRVFIEGANKIGYEGRIKVIENN